MADTKRNGCDKYEDIMDLPAHIIGRRRISRHDRAAQFAPFAALTGFAAVINETSRLTESRPGQDEQTLRLLNERIKIIEENIRERPEIEVTFFVPDERKDGGSLQKYRGNIRRADKAARELVFMDKTVISIDDVIFIEGKIFKNIAPDTYV